jgi:hypothetical protein
MMEGIHGTGHRHACRLKSPAASVLDCRVETGPHDVHRSGHDPTPDSMRSNSSASIG